METKIYQYEIEQIGFSAEEFAEIFEAYKKIAKSMSKENLGTLNEGFDKIMNYVKTSKYERPKFHNGVDDKVLEECAKHYDQLSDEEKAEVENTIALLKKELGIEE